MQSKADSFMEALTNTVVGLTVATVTQIAIVYAYQISMSWSTLFQSIGWFTVVSVIRQYAIRRLFNGRTIWQALKEKIK